MRTHPSLADYPCLLSLDDLNISAFIYTLVAYQLLCICVTVVREFENNFSSTKCVYEVFLATLTAKSLILISTRDLRIGSALRYHTVMSLERDVLNVWTNKVSD